MKKETEINEAIKTLTEKTSKDITADEALKFTQAALNMAHVAQVLKNVEGK